MGMTKAKKAADSNEPRRQAYAFRRGSLTGKRTANTAGSGGIFVDVVTASCSYVVNAVRFRGVWELHLEDQRREHDAVFYVKRSELQATYDREAPGFFGDAKPPKLQIWGELTKH